MIVARGLRKVYRRGKVGVEALRGVDLETDRGAFVVIVGPSGGGKTTLLQLIGGVDRPTAGQICVNGVALEEASEAQLTSFRRDNIGFVFQFYNLLSSFSALDNVALPLLAKGWPRSTARERGMDLLKQVGLCERQAHKPGELSGGEQQRVAIARALATNPAVILADEPTGDLDSTTAEDVLQLMRHLNQNLEVTFVIATHNQQICAYATQTYEMRDGQLFERTISP